METEAERMVEESMAAIATPLFDPEVNELEIERYRCLMQLGSRLAYLAASINQQPERLEHLLQPVLRPALEHLGCNEHMTMHVKRYEAIQAEAVQVDLNLPDDVLHEAVELATDWCHALKKYSNFLQKHMRRWG